MQRSNFSNSKYIFDKFSATENSFFPAGSVALHKISLFFKKINIFFKFLLEKFFFRVYIRNIVNDDNAQQRLKRAPIAQLDRASGYGPEG